jgi:phosphomannomutase
MDARVLARYERAIREAFATHCGPHDDWMPLRLVAQALPGVSKAVLTEALTELERADKVVLASNPARMHMVEADHDWEIHGRHLLHVRPTNER